MKITKKTGCAISILTVIGRKKSDVVPLKSIAEESLFSVPFARKVVHELEKLGYVRSVMGPKGGYSLAMDPCRIDLDSLISDIEERNDVVECIYSKSCGKKCECLINKTMRNLNSEVKKIFKKYTIEDFIKGVSNGKNNLS